MQNIILEVDCRNISISELHSQIVIKINAKFKVKGQNAQQPNPRLLHAELIEPLQQRYSQLFRSKIIKDAPPPAPVAEEAPTDLASKQMAQNTDSKPVRTQRENIFNRKEDGQAGNRVIANNTNRNQNQETSNDRMFRRNIFTANNSFQQPRPNAAGTSLNSGNNNLLPNNLFLTPSQQQQKIPSMFSSHSLGSSTESARRPRGPTRIG